jgi:short-subunit dehydrogenase
MIKKNKVAIITGAGKGIGKAVTIGLANLGYQTILVGRNIKDLDELAISISKDSEHNPEVIQLDITSSEKVKIAISEIYYKYNRIDILVNNAGIYIEGSVDISETNFTKMLETNLTAQYIFLHEIIPIMKNQKSGYIFNVASRAGKIGFAESGAYSASKFGLVGLNESLYRELVPLGISVTALCPGWVNTNMAIEAGTKLHAEKMIQPEDLFNTVKWLLSLSPGACVKEVILENPLSIG